MFGESEIFKFIYYEAYEKENKYAIQMLAEWYQTGTYVQASDELYIKELEHLFDVSEKGGHLGDAIRIAKDLYDEQYGGYLMAKMSQEDWICNSLLSVSGEELGVYYAGFSDIESLKKAEYYLRVALWCHADIKELLEETEARLVLLRKTNADMPRLNDNIKALRSAVYTSINEVVSESKIEAWHKVADYVKNQFDEHNWIKLQQETQSYLITATYSLVELLNVIQFEGYSVDYGGVISLLMRALELELRLRFHKKYIEFLESKYPDPLSFAVKNNLQKSDYVRIRASLLRRTGDRICYQNPDKSGGVFVQGAFRYVIGLHQVNNEYDTDNTMKEYCRDCLFSKNLSDDQINATLHTLYKDVEIMRRMRNNASHGGVVLSQGDAEFAFDRMILTYKMLNKLTSMCRY